jgi:polyisoprenoid-binding protein YceI
MEVERYVIDPSMSRFTVRAFATGMFSALGHNPTLAIREYSGQAEFVPGALEKATLHLTINAGSLVVTDNISDKDRREIEQAMNQDVLETGRYPEIVFDSSAVSGSDAGNGQYWVKIMGNLSLHGATKSQTLPARVALSGDTLRANGEFALLQTAYGIKLVSVAGGTLKVKDELKCSFDIVARRQTETK